jgi:GNAT superfamily N-acetyltransferase
LETLGEGLAAHAQSQDVDCKPRDFSCTVRDAEGALIGGATGNSIGCYTYIARLWVAESHRGNGIGRRLVRAAEAIAAKRNCRYVFLNTFRFQAGRFYGYQMLASIDSPDDPRLSRTFMIKTLER